MKKPVLLTELRILPADGHSDPGTAPYINKLRQMEYILDQFNLLDHPTQIQHLCQEMKKIKKQLKRMEAERKSLLSNHLAN
jgi:hypothetical protein